MLRGAAVSRRRVLVTGITGQDGWYLNEMLQAEGTEVVGLVRPRRGVEVPGVAVIEADLEDPEALRHAVRAVAPHELYHLAAPTFVPASWEDPAGSLRAVAGGTAALLAACRELHDPPRFFLASSAEVFGDAGVSPQSETSPMRPRSPYGVAKLAALGLVRVFREAGLHASAGLLYNHESPRRPERFVTRKITAGAAAIARGSSGELRLGDLSAVRDWSHARDVMRGAVLAVRHDTPGDYVFASGVGRTVGDWVTAAFAAAGVSPEGRVVVDEAFVRPPEPCPLVGDPSLARSVLGWEPSVSFDELVAEMVRADLAAGPD